MNIIPALEVKEQEIKDKQVYFCVYAKRKNDYNW